MKIRVLALASLCLASACACSKPPEEAWNESASFFYSSIGATIRTAGVTIEVIDVPCHTSMHSRTPGETTSEATINGLPFSVRDGVFTLGTHSFGSTPEGAQIRVTKEGVVVNGERRGDLPDAGVSDIPELSR